MKHSLTQILTVFAIAFLSYTAQAQTTHTVTVTNFEFEPASLTINQGDTVEFLNLEGTHNVNGTQETFPDNPIAFGNDVGVGWEYTLTFNTPGEYDYICDVHPSLMQASITVNPVSSVNEETVKQEAVVSVYPNPATEFVIFDFSGFETETAQMTITIFNSAGALVAEKKVSESTKVRLETSDFSTGLYTYSIQQEGKVMLTGHFMTR